MPLGERVNGYVTKLYKTLAQEKEIGQNQLKIAWRHLWTITYHLRAFRPSSSS